MQSPAAVTQSHFILVHSLRKEASLGSRSGVVGDVAFSPSPMPWKISAFSELFSHLIRLAWSQHCPGILKMCSHQPTARICDE